MIAFLFLKSFIYFRSFYSGKKQFDCSSKFPMATET